MREFRYSKVPPGAAHTAYKIFIEINGMGSRAFARDPEVTMPAG